MPLPAGRTITLGGVQVSDEGVKEGYNLDRSSTTHILRVDWLDRVSLINYLFNTGSGLPYQYPDANWLYVDEVDVEGDGVLNDNSGAGRIGYDLAVLAVTYRPVTYGADAVETGAVQIDLGEEIFTAPMDGVSFKFTDGLGGIKNEGQIPPDASPGIRIKTGQVSIARNNLHSLDLSTYQSLINTTNSAIMFGTFPVQTLLFGGLSTGRRFSNGGSERWNASISWEYRSVGWNKTWRAAVVNKSSGAVVTNAGWYEYKIHTSAGTTYQFPPVSHAALLTF